MTDADAEDAMVERGPDPVAVTLAARGRKRRQEEAARPDAERLHAEIGEYMQATARNLVEIGARLQPIRDRRLYRSLGHTSFDNYCRTEWRFGRNYADKLIRAANEAKRLSTTAPNPGTVVPTPNTERAIRALLVVKDDDNRVRVVEDATEAAGGATVTAKRIEAEVQRRKIAQPAIPQPEARRSAEDFAKACRDFARHAKALERWTPSRLHAIAPHLDGDEALANLRHVRAVAARLIAELETDSEV